MRAARKRRPRRRRIGKVSYYFHHGSWWVYYLDGQRQVRRRTGPDEEAAEAIAAQVNAQLTTSAPTMFSFAPLTVPELCQRFLDHHEHVLRSSLATVRRYRTAIQHLENFASRGAKDVPAHQIDADRFVKYLRSLHVAPNGHPHAVRRKLRDKGVQFILQTCRSLYSYAAKKRHLPPYGENPFSGLAGRRFQIEDAKRVKQKKMNRFKKFGGATPCEIYGYIKPEDAETFDDWRKDDAAKRTVFPGQHARCWYCGWHVIWGANGVTQNLQCSASRDWRCWNSFGFKGSLSAERIVPVITAELAKLAGFEDQFADMVRSARQDRSGSTANDWRQLLNDEAALATEMENFQKAIAMFGAHPTLLEPLNGIESREKELAQRRSRLERLRTKDLELPECMGELRPRLEDKFLQLASDSPEFGDLMRQMVPEFYVYLVRLVDGGHPLPFAKVKLALAGIVPDAALVPGLGELLTRELTLDLFEKPPQRERIRVEAARLAAEHVPQRQIAARLTEEKPKLPVVQEALALDRKMKELGLETPYVLVTEPPDDYPKLRRHNNPKYRFQPYEGYQRPAI